MARMKRGWAAAWAFGAVVCAAQARQEAGTKSAPADLIVHNAKVLTQSDELPEATALAVREGLFVEVGTDEQVLALRGEKTRVLDAAGRRVIPGLNDSHIHAVRAGKYYNLELRWDGVRSLSRGLEMVRRQAARTPKGQWVRVIGGWSPYQFEERRMPTVAELNAAAPETPVFVLFLYSRGMVNRAGAEALGISAAAAAPEGGRYEMVDGGAILHAEPNPMILYTTIAKLPELSPEDRVNSTRQFMAELNRFGLTSVVDPGGGGHSYPEDYVATIDVVKGSPTPVRISNYLFAQKAGRELADYREWTSRQRLSVNMAMARLNGFVIEGAGENLVWSAGDFENFLAPRPDLKPGMEEELGAVVRVLAEHQWPIRIHATYDESITRVLDVFEPIFKESGYTARWCIDHAETISKANIARIKAMGGGIAVQNRLSFAGEYFSQRYGADVSAVSPPVRAMLDAGLPVGAGTDATRVSSHNPWLAIEWLVTGRTVGGTPLAGRENRLTPAEALRLFTLGSAWFSGEETVKGRIAPGQYADFAVLTDDPLRVDADRLDAIESVLTVTGGDIVFATGAIAGAEAPRLPAVRPEWSPVTIFGGYQRE